MLNIIRVILPDIIMFIVSFTVLLICIKLVPREDPQLQEVDLSRPPAVRRRIFQHTAMLINLVGELLVVLLLAASGIARPSVLSSMYFIVFIGVATTWGCYKTLGKKFSIVRMFLLAYAALHLIVVYLYQFQYFQDALAPTTLYAR